MTIKRKNLFIGIIAVLLVLVVGFVCVSAKAPEVIQQQVRTIELNTETDYASILNEFENSELKTDGSLTTFVGYQTLSADLFAEFDNVSENDIEQVSGSTVQYKMSYDEDNNIVTIQAELINEICEIQIDTISGVAFINESGNIDAVMNLDGEGVLLSEMQQMGLIANCGWFSNLFKRLAVAIAVVAVAVAAVAIVVATAGAAAPAVVAAGVGVTTAVTTGVGVATTIATYAVLTAALAAGVAMTVDLVEKYYPGIGATTTTIGGVKYITAPWSKEKTKEAVRDIATAKQKESPKDPAIYFRVMSYSTGMGPTKVALEPYTKAVMATNMKLNSWSSLTISRANAHGVISSAFPGFPIIEDFHGMAHFHAVAANGQHMTGANNQYTVHSYHYIF